MDYTLSPPCTSPSLSSCRSTPPALSLAFLTFTNLWRMLSLFWDAAGVQGGAWEQIGGSRMPIPLMYVMVTLR